jgi:hypothetical protein
MALEGVEKSTCDRFGDGAQVNNRLNPPAPDGRDDGRRIVTVCANMIVQAGKGLGDSTREANHLVPSTRQLSGQRHPNETTSTHDQEPHAPVYNAAWMPSPATGPIVLN